jgi:hypothetical protein
MVQGEIPMTEPWRELKYMAGFFQEDLLPETGSFVVFTSYDLWVKHKDRITNKFEGRGYKIKEVKLKKGVQYLH